MHRLAILFALLSSFAMAQQLNFRNIDFDNAFPSSEVYSILQDSKGYIWFSSNGGICKYDGNSTKLFSVANGLPDNSVFKICEGTNGKIIFYTISGKIGYIIQDSVHLCGFNDALNKKLNMVIPVMDIYEDSESNLWVATPDGLYKTNLPGNYSKLKMVDDNCSSCNLSANVIENNYAIASRHPNNQNIDAKGIDFSISIYNKSKKFNFHYFFYNKKNNPSFHKTLVTSKGNLIISFQNRLIIIHPDGHYDEKTFDKWVLCLTEGKSGNIWVGFKNGGLSCYENESFSKIKHHSLNRLSVSNFIIDNESGVWTSTLEKGIFYAPSYEVIGYSNVPGLDEKIFAVGKIGTKIFANNHSNRFSVITGSNIETKAIKGDTTAMSISDYLLIDKDLYISTSISTFRTDTGFNAWHELRIKGKPAGAFIYNLTLAPDKKLFGINHSYIFEIDKNGMELVTTLPSKGRCITVNRSGELLAACLDGIYIYTNGMLKPYLSGLNIQKITKISESPDGFLWVLTSESGISVLKDRKLLRTVSEKDGLASNDCRDIVFDKKGNAYVATSQGLSKIITSENCKIENFNKRHGLISNEVLKLDLHDSKLWIGTNDGLCSVDLEELRRNKIAPPINIKQIFVNDSITSQKNFDHYQNKFRFVLNELTFKNNTRSFLYRLMDADTAWRIIHSNEITFTNLNPGNYVFEAKALNADGVVSKNSVQFKFTIARPFWDTWWFITLVLLIFFSGIYFFIAYRLRIIKRKEEEKTRISKTIAEFQMAALQAQMNPHFIFNAINGIQNYILENKNQLAYDYIAKLSKLVRLVLNNAMENSITLEKELEMLFNYIKIQQMRFESKFDFNIVISDELDHFETRLPPMLIQPCVENAIWHGLMPLKNIRKGILEIKIESEDGNVKITVFDNGIGRVNAKKNSAMSNHKSVSMDLTQQRFRILNSIPEYSGSKIITSDLYDKDNVACGTRVEITIPNK